MSRSLHQFTLLLKEVRLIEKKKNGLMPSAISVATDTASVRPRLRPLHVRSHALLSHRSREHAISTSLSTFATAMLPTTSSLAPGSALRCVLPHTRAFNYWNCCCPVLASLTVGARELPRLQATEPASPRGGQGLGSDGDKMDSSDETEDDSNTVSGGGHLNSNG